MLALCNSPFLVGLVTAFQDDACLYLVMECVMGGDFFTHLQVTPRPRPAASATGCMPHTS